MTFHYKLIDGLKMVYYSRITIMVKYVKQRKSRICTCVSLPKVKISRISSLNQLKKPLHTIKNVNMHRKFSKNCDFYYIPFYFMANISKICQVSNETIAKIRTFRCFTPFTSSAHALRSRSLTKFPIASDI